MTNGEIKRATTLKPTNQGMTHGWLKAKAAAGDLTGIRLCRSAKMLTPRSAAVEIEEKSAMPASSRHATFSGGFTTQVSHQLVNTK
jgi:hypothetical protein